MTPAAVLDHPTQPAVVDIPVVCACCRPCAGQVDWARHAARTGCHDYREENQ